VQERIVKRVILMVTVATLVVLAMTVASVGTAFAKACGTNDSPPGPGEKNGWVCIKGGDPPHYGPPGQA
jgi:hypothetical protein